MEHARLELRLSSSSSSSRVIVAGAVGGQVVGAIIDPSATRIVQTQVSTRIAQQMGAAVSLDPAAGGVLINGQTAVMVKKKRTHYHIKRVWAERESGLVTHLLLASNNVFAPGGPEHVVPAEQIETFESKNITLAAGVRSVDQFPIYRDDADIASDVGIVIDQVLLEPRARRMVHARVEDGHIEFSGLLDTEEQNDALIQRTESIPGARGVRSDVVVTERLANLASAAIDALMAKGKLPPDAQIEVLSEHQIVYLNGVVPTSRASADAESAALGVTGVRIVVNNLQVKARADALPADPASPRTHLK